MKDKQTDIATVSLPGEGPSHRPYLISSLCDFEKTYFEHGEDAHRHDFYAIFWIKQGKIIHTVDEHSDQIKGNALFLLAPGQVHKLVFADRAEGWLIAFSDTFLCLKDQAKYEDINCALFFNPQFNSVIGVKEEQAQILEQIIRLMVFESESSGDQRGEGFFNLLKYFLVLLSRISDKHLPSQTIHTGTYRQSVFLKFRQLIEQHYASKNKVADYAVQLHIGPVQLNGISKQVSGITAGAHIRNRLLMEAKRYLHHTDFSSKEIAYKLGFEDPHYFSRFFKKYAGQSPQEFKFMSRRESSLIN